MRGLVEHFFDDHRRPRVPEAAFGHGFGQCSFGFCWGRADGHALPGRKTVRLHDARASQFAHIGNRVVIPVKEFEAWLGERAKTESAQIDRIVIETLEKFDLE